MSDTPETDEAQFGTGRVSVDFARRLERERDDARNLAAEIGLGITHSPDCSESIPCMRCQRDALRKENRKLREALKECREDSVELLGERDWWKDEPRGNHLEQYKQTEENIRRADELLKEKP